MRCARLVLIFSHRWIECVQYLPIRRIVERRVFQPWLGRPHEEGCIFQNANLEGKALEEYYLLLNTLFSF